MECVCVRVLCEWMECLIIRGVFGVCVCGECSARVTCGDQAVIFERARVGVESVDDRNPGPQVPS